MTSASTFLAPAAALSMAQELRRWCRKGLPEFRYAPAEGTPGDGYTCGFCSWQAMEGRYVGPPRAILPISSCEQRMAIWLPSASLRGFTVTVYDGRFFGLDCFRMPTRWYVHGTNERVKHCLMYGATPCFSHLLTSVLTLLALSGMSLSRCLDSSNCLFSFDESYSRRYF